MALSNNDRVPADNGVTTLALLMQLGGSLFAALATLVASIRLLELRHGGRSEALWLFLVLGLSIARSLYQRIAGNDLLYGAEADVDGHARSPLAALKRYIVLALVHSVVLTTVFVEKFDMGGTLAVWVFAGLVLWPTVLLVLMSLGIFAPFTTGVPVTEDKGFEGAAIVMTLLGVCGAIVVGTGLAVAIDLGPSQAREMLGIVALALLVVRSVLHVHAGSSGLRETSIDRAAALANRYANFGVITAFCASGALLLVTLSQSFEIEAFALAVIVCWMLVIWPLIVRRFFSERQFADLVLASDGATHRRAPDGGLTGLGWLLLAHAVASLSFLLPQIAMAGGGRLPSDMSELLFILWPFGARGHSLYWNCGLALLEGWAAYELIRMAHQMRHVATACAIAIIGVSLYMYWPVLSSYGWVRATASATLLAFAPVAIQFAIPIATLVLVHRRLAPTARARFRTPPSG